MRGLKDSRTKYIERVVKNYDYELYADRNREGVLCVYRKSFRYIPFDMGEKRVLFNLIPSPQFVFALTDSWRTNGRPVDWGAEQIIQKLRSMDHFQNERMFEQMEAENEKVEERQKRHLRNEMEAFFADERGRFQKATNDFIVGSRGMPQKKVF